MRVITLGSKTCGPCRMVDQRLDKFDKCEVIKYDIDDEIDDLLEKYNIRNIPVTILTDDNDNEIQRWVGIFDINELNDKIAGTDA